MTDPQVQLGRNGRGSDSFDGGHRHAENADLEGQPERGLVIDDYDSQTRGEGSLTQASIGGIDPALGGSSSGPSDGLPGTEPDLA
jgi:hypothetical protein